MDCRHFHDLLDDYLAGGLEHRVEGEARRHAASCPECGELVALLGGAWTELSPAPPAELVESILVRTCGSPCVSARSRLCAYLDDELGAADAQLVQLHVEQCHDCGGLLATLSRLQRELPRMAELDPDDRFVADVVAATVPRARRLRRRLAGLAAAFGALVRRPRFALEGAYLGTAVLLLVFGFPGSPLADVPRRVLSLSQVNPVEQLSPPTRRIRDEVSGVLTASRYQLADSSRELAFDARKHAARSVGAARETLTRVGLGLKRWWQDGPPPAETEPARSTKPGSAESEIPC